MSIETFLTERGFSFTAQTVALKDVVFDGSLQTRAQRLDPETVERYAASIKNGASMPPIVVFQGSKGLTNVDGFHRGEAYRRAGRKTINVLIVAAGTSEQELRALAVELNDANGRPVTKDEKWEMALSLLANGAGIRATAQRFGLSEPDLGAAARRQDTANDLNEHGIAAHRLNRPVLTTLHAISGPVRYATAKVAVQLKSQVPDKEMQDFIRELKESRAGESVKLRMVATQAAEWRQQMTATPARISIRKARQERDDVTRFQKALRTFQTTLSTLDPSAIKAAGAARRKESITLAKNVAEQLDKFITLS